jgi:SagB-type dehydrogenase family enzyme
LIFVPRQQVEGTASYVPNQALRSSDWSHVSKMDQSEVERLPTGEQNLIECVLAYHRRTKHHLHRFAASPGYLDWATQPDPFRTYAGAERVKLPLIADRLKVAFDQAQIPGSIPIIPLNLDSVAILFELALGLSAWKQYESTRWALRCNPSSGNLHPTEGYAILPEIPSIGAGVYHYVSRDHWLERRCILAGQAAQDLAESLPPASFLLGLSSIHWREAWKYGERAFRYCQHDIGHAIASIRYAAAALGWSAKLLKGVSDPAISDLLGLNRPESVAAIDEQDREHPDALMLIGPPDGSRLRRDEESTKIHTPELLSVIAAGTWVGVANPLSPSHVEWQAIDAVTEATWRKDQAAEINVPDAVVVGDDFPALLIPPVDRAPINAAQLIRQRRSAVAFDGATSISVEAFYGMLHRLFPLNGLAPWDAWPYPPHIHCAIFVHRVRDLASGLYLLERSSTVHEHLRSALRPEFLWKRPEGCPKHLPLFTLMEGDFRQMAAGVSCHQEIAGNGAFSLGMIAEFSESIGATGAWWYRRLFWEAGLLGQVLYLEAEAAGVRGTGIGCYFDDAVHNLLGLNGDLFQSLYHFTVGGPVDDSRLTTLPPYSHLERR